MSDQPKHDVDRRAHRRLAARRAWLAVVVAAGLMMAAGATAAEPDGAAKVRLVMVDDHANPDSADARRFDKKKRREILDIAATRVRKRLKTAKIKQFTVTTEAPRTLHVSALGGVSRGLLAGIVAPAGSFSLRPVAPAGAAWVDHGAAVPDGVRIRQNKSSQHPADAHLWSRSRRRLEQAVEAIDLEGRDVRVYPEAGGWRTICVGRAVATRRDLAGARLGQSKMGEWYVRADFNHGVNPATVDPGERQWAVVVDGEIVAVLSRSGANFGTALNVTAPDHLGSESARKNWARQVAGRLAAHLPIPMVELAADR